MPQAGLVLLAAYFGLGLVVRRAYSWPLLVGPGPFFVVLCLYLAARLPRRAPHLYGLVRFTTVYSIPYAVIALVRGHLVTDHPFVLGDLPPILLGITLLLRLRAWRRLFDASPAEGMDQHRALLVELFAGVGTCSLPLAVAAQFPVVLRGAQRLVHSSDLIPPSVYMVMLVQLMALPALAAAVIGWGMFRSRGATSWIRAAFVFVAVMTLVHGSMTLVFAKDSGSRLSAALWTVMLIGFGAWIRGWYREHPPEPLPGAPHIF